MADLCAWADAELPEKFHEVLKIVIKDVKACEADPKYRLNMTVWHARQPKSVCYVCMAGAVMAKTLKIDTAITGHVRPHDFEPETEDTLLAIDHIRDGEIEEAFYHMNIQKDEYPKDLDTFPRPFSDPEWADSFEEFIESWEKAQQWLEDRNL